MLREAIRQTCTFLQSRDQSYGAAICTFTPHTYKSRKCTPDALSMHSCLERDFSMPNASSVNHVCVSGSNDESPNRTLASWRERVTPPTTVNECDRQTVLETGRTFQIFQIRSQVISKACSNRKQSIHPPAHLLASPRVYQLHIARLPQV